MSAALDDAVGRLYDAFSAHRLKEIEYCPCGCTDPRFIDALSAQPLRELRAGEAARYASSAISTIGDDRDFRHFLPRLLELASRRDALSVDLEILMNKLQVASWRDWPAGERAAVEAFLVAWWEDAIESEAERYAAQVICAIGQVVDDLGSYLEKWDPEPGIERRVVLLDNPFWLPDQLAQVVDWLAIRRGETSA